MGLFGFAKDVQGELKHVSWPTRKQVINATILVIVLSLVTAAIIGALDFGFTRSLTSVIAEPTTNGEQILLEQEIDLSDLTGAGATETTEGDTAETATE